MRLSQLEQLAEIFKSATNDKFRSNSNPVNKLKTKIWINALLNEQNISAFEFESKYLMKGYEKTGVVRNWVRGISTATGKSVQKVSEIFPGSEEVYYLPVFLYLQNKPLRQSELDRSILQYARPNEDFFWDFPTNNFDDRYKMAHPNITLQEDSQQLAQRYDIYGFIAILYLLRKADANGDADRHHTFIKAAYRAFPSFARHPYFKNYWKELFDALFLVHRRLGTSTLLVYPNIGILHSQIFSKNHVPLREHRPRDPLTHRFIMPEEPYFTPQFPDVINSPDLALDNFNELEDIPSKIE